MTKYRAQTDERPFSFLPLNEREMKPRQRGLTEIRGPYYSVVGTRYLQDLLEFAGAYVDMFKFGGGSFMVPPTRVLRELIDTLRTMVSSQYGRIFASQHSSISPRDQVRKN